MNMIEWWDIKIDETDIKNISQNILAKNITQGKVTLEFEKEISTLLNAPYIVCCSSGTSALTMSFMAIGLKPNDEVIMPSRTYVATANAALILGAKVKLVDCNLDDQLINIEHIEKNITKMTKAIVPVHLNGKIANMKIINQIAKKYNLMVIEDSAQAILSSKNNQYAGTFSDFGCFSLGLAKLFTSVSGGFVVCHNKDNYNKLLRIRNQGVLNAKKDFDYKELSHNFRYSDIYASIGLNQIKKICTLVNHQNKIYSLYEEGLKKIPYLKILKMNTNSETVMRPIYLCENIDLFIAKMKEKNVICLKDSSSLDKISYINNKQLFKNSDIFHKKSLILPSGPNQSINNIKKVIKIIQNLDL